MVSNWKTVRFDRRRVTVLNRQWKRCSLQLFKRIFCCTLPAGYPINLVLCTSWNYLLHIHSSTFRCISVINPTLLCLCMWTPMYIMVKIWSSSTAYIILHHTLEKRELQITMQNKDSLLFHVKKLSVHWADSLRWININHHQNSLNATCLQSLTALFINSFL